MLLTKKEYDYISELTDVDYEGEVSEDGQTMYVDSIGAENMAHELLYKIEKLQERVEELEDEVEELEENQRLIDPYEEIGMSPEDFF